MKYQYSIFRRFIFLTVLTTLHAKSVAEMRPYLNLDAAQAGLNACRNYAEKHNLKFAISIKDRAGRDVLFARMDDVFQKQAELSRIKAETASTTPVSTKKLAELVSTNAALSGLAYLPGVTTVEGGVPIKLRDGYNIGAVGVSGGTPQQDGICASAAADAISKHLKKSLGK